MLQNTNPHAFFVSLCTSSAAKHMLETGRGDQYTHSLGQEADMRARTGPPDRDLCLRIMGPARVVVQPASMLTAGLRPSLTARGEQAGRSRWFTDLPSAARPLCRLVHVRVLSQMFLVRIPQVLCSPVTWPWHRIFPSCLTGGTRRSTS